MKDTPTSQNCRAHRSNTSADGDDASALRSRPLVSTASARKPSRSASRVVTRSSQSRSFASKRRIICIRTAPSKIIFRLTNVSVAPYLVPYFECCAFCTCYIHHEVVPHAKILAVARALLLWFQTPSMNIFSCAQQVTRFSISPTLAPAPSMHSP